MFQDDQVPDAARKMLARFGTAIEFSDHYPDGLVNLTDSEIADDDLEALNFYPGFSALHLDRTEVTDHGLSYVQEMSALEDLSLHQTKVTDAGLRKLSGLGRLERLDIGTCPGCFTRGLRPVPAKYVTRNQVTDLGLTHLVDLTCLRVLRMRATRVTDQGLLECLPAMPHLTELNLGYLEITGRSLEACQQLSALENLNLRHTAVESDSIVRLLDHFTHTLREVNLDNTVIDDQTLRSFPMESALRKLEISDTAISDDGLRHIAGLQNLEDLTLSFTAVTDDGIRYLQDRTSLTGLELFHTEVTDTSLVWLSDLQINTLGLGATQVTDAGMPSLTDFSELECLDLAKTSIADRGLRFLNQSAKLTTLFLESTRITNDGLAHLTQLPIESLSINLGINKTGMTHVSNISTLRHLAIWKGIGTLNNLQKLTELRVLLIDDSVTDFSPIRELKKLRFLMLWGNTFPSTELAKLRLALPQCRFMSYRSNEDPKPDFRTLCNKR